MNNNLWLVIKREFLTKVKRKSFIFVTLLTPLAMIILMVAPGYFASKSISVKNILVQDESQVFKNSKPVSKTMNFSFTDDDFEKLKESYEEDYDILIHIDEFTDLSSSPKVRFVSKETMSLMTSESLESKIAKAFRSHKLDVSSIDKTEYENLETEVTMLDASEKAEGDSNSKVAMGVSTAFGGFMAFLMYMVILLYGSMVMRSVMEEKMNRIVEVIVSSVKPFQLMLGKIIGASAVGTVQLVIWMLLVGIGYFVVNATMGSGAMGQVSEMTGGINAQDLEATGLSMDSILKEIGALNWPLIIPVIIIFFIAGFFVYSSLFAAAGSAMSDDLGESQSLTIPIMIPVILAIMMMGPVLNDPHGSIAIFGSLFPLTSPVLMPARLPFDPPMWQVLLSVVLVIAAAVFFIWLAGRIYRVGILMYGKKVNFKEIGKWLFYKG